MEVRFRVTGFSDLSMKGATWGNTAPTIRDTYSNDRLHMLFAP